MHNAVSERPPSGDGKVLVLTTKDIAGLLDPAESIAVIEAALSEPQAMSEQTLPRRRLYVPVQGKDAEYYWHNNMAGAFVAGNTLAVRLDVSRMRIFDQRQECPGDFTGLVLLYDLEKSEPYAIIHDHGLSPIRVAATSALATRELAVSDASVLGIIGTGEQAVAHALTHTSVMPQLSTVLYYSRTAENRERAARETYESTGVNAEAVSSAEEIVERSHVLVAATNATQPVFDSRQIHPGQHVTTIASADRFVPRREVDDRCFDLADVIVVNSRAQITADQQTHFTAPAAAAKLDQVIELTDVLSGQVAGRTDDNQITLYDNNVGMGIQFAAVGALAYQKARAAGIGVDLPADLFVTRKAPGELYAP